MLVALYNDDSPLNRGSVRRLSSAIVSPCMGVSLLGASPFSGISFLVLVDVRTASFGVGMLNIELLFCWRRFLSFVFASFGVLFYSVLGCMTGQFTGYGLLVIIGVIEDQFGCCLGLRWLLSSVLFVAGPLCVVF